MNDPLEESLHVPDATPRRGKVFLVGGGPGDPELITRKAHRILQTADVVLHDELVSAEVLALASDKAQIVNVGKRCGTKAITQSAIHALMIDYARLGLLVVRLKGGDPMIFGRASEELAALREADIEAEVIPGVTTILGAAASLQFSLTDRFHASKVIITTAHRAGEASGREWNNTIGEGTTLVIYMPGEDYGTLARELMETGLAPETSCLVVSHACLTTQQTLLTTLGNLSSCGISLNPPSVVIVGAVVNGSLLLKVPPANGL